MNYYIYCFCIIGISLGLNACSTSDDSTKAPSETIIPDREPRVELAPLSPDEYQNEMVRCLNIRNQTVNQCQSQVNSSKFIIVQPSR